MNTNLWFFWWWFDAKYFCLGSLNADSQLVDGELELFSCLHTHIVHRFLKQQQQHHIFLIITQISFLNWQIKLMKF